MVKLNTISKISTTALALTWVAIMSSHPVYGMEGPSFAKKAWESKAIPQIIEVNAEIEKILMAQEEKRPRLVLDVLNAFTRKLTNEQRGPSDLELLQLDTMYDIAEKKRDERYTRFIEGHKKIIKEKCEKHETKETPKTKGRLSPEAVELESYLTILGRVLPSQKTWVFNEYLKLKKKYEAPFLPRSFYIFETPKDVIGKFYVEKLVFIVPDILRDESLNLDLHGRIELANRYASDLTSFHRDYRWSYTIPSSVAEFYKFALTSGRKELTDSEKFDVLTRLCPLSEKDGTEYFLKVLHTPTTSFGLRHKLAHYGKTFLKGAPKQEGEKFIREHAEEILEDAHLHHRGLTSLSKMGVPVLHAAEALGQGVTVAVCDGGFFKIIPLTYESKYMTMFGADEKSYQWKLLHGQNVLPVKIHDKGWLTEIKNPNLPYHGSEMSDLVATMSPLANILPVALDTNRAQSVIAALDDLEQDPSVHIISCSFGFPRDNAQHMPVVDPGVKQSILKCLRSNKILVLGTGNNGGIIPATPGFPQPAEPQGGIDYLDTLGSGISDILYEQKVAFMPSVISSLFEGEKEDSPIFTNLILVGSSKANSLDLHDKSVKPGNGPAQQRFVYADADNMQNFFDESLNWGGTSAATAMVSGILADLWSQVKTPNEKTAARVSQALLENTDTQETLPLSVRGCGKVNAEKALENLENY